MTTTTLVGELLVIGLEALIWIALLVGSVFGLDWLPVLSVVFDKAGVLISVILVSIAYTLGVIIEQACDALVGTWEGHIERRIQKRADKRFGQTWREKWEIYYRSGKIIGELEYMRSRRRVLRASIVNIALTLIFGVVFLWTRTSSTSAERISLSVAASVIGLLLISFTLFVYRRITAGYFMVLQEVNKLLEEDKAEKGLKSVCT